ncbi:MAG: SxtJ family membrane protein [Candidatus Krumholzibacteriia bacterium]
MSIIRDVATELKKLKQDRAALRNFGLTMAAALALIGVAMHFVGRHPRRAFWTWVVAAAFLFFGLVAPRALKGIHRAWMALAFVLGWFVSRIILGVIFFGVITPIGVVMKLAGKDVLREKIDRSATTYWIPRESAAEDPKRCEKPF